MTNTVISKFEDSYYFVVLKKLLGHLKEAKNTQDIQKLLDILKKEAEISIKKDIRSSILPTSVSKKDGRNFYLPKEGLLVEEEVNQLLDDLIGVYIFSSGNVYILKIKNNLLFENYLNNIKQQGFENGIDIKKILNEVNINKYNIYIKNYSNIALFLLLNDFILYILNNIPKDNILKDILQLHYIKGVFTVLSTQKKKKYYITNLSEFIKKFYKRELNCKPEYSIIGSFLFSFYIQDNDFQDKLLGLLDKFLYYIIFKYYINWKILCEMLNIFYTYKNKNKKEIYIKSAKEFYNMMNLEKIYDWAYAIGKTILDKDKENGKDYINEIIKEIKKEELPGKFKEELSKVIHKISEKIRKNTGDKEFNLSVHPDIIKKDLQGDEFYKVKAAVLSGLINSL